MQVYWFEQTSADVSANNDWLSSREQDVLAGMRIPKRRHDWRLGRWTAKRTVAAYLRIREIPRALAEIEIRSAPSGMPEVFITGSKVRPAISISHRAHVAACAVSSSSSALGCDVELIELRSESFAADYFTTEEREIVDAASKADRALLLTLLWSAKESALKALGEGLRLDTRCVQVRPAFPVCRATAHKWGCAVKSSLIGSERWFPLQVRNGSDRVFYGWWTQGGMLVRTVVTDPPSGAPRALKPTADYPQKVPADFRSATAEGSPANTG